MPAVESTNNSAGLSGTGPYYITGYTQSMVNLCNADTIHFDRNATITGTWSITAAITSGGSTTTPPIPTMPNNNIVSYNPNTGSITLTSGDPLYPPGSTVVFTATCTRTSDGVVATTVLNVTMPLTEIVPTLVGGGTSITSNPNDPQNGIYTYVVGDNTGAALNSQYIEIVAVPSNANYSIEVTSSNVASVSATGFDIVSSRIYIEEKGSASINLTDTYEFKYIDTTTSTAMPLGVKTANNTLQIDIDLT